jgi:peptidoglycan/xylan/chitin deacetylase (PgdA/CDA1 family)
VIPSGTLLFVNFHHVRPHNPPDFPALHHRTLDQLRGQIRALAEVFDIVDCGRAERFIRGESETTQPMCVLTFDDGLRDHFEHVLPILDEAGLKGMFFVNTLPWRQGTLLSVHMAHLLSARFAYADLREEVEDAAARCGFASTVADVRPELARAQYRYDDERDSVVKYFINAVVPQALRAGVLDIVFRARIGDPAPFVASHYMTPEMVRGLGCRGHAVGMHTHAHLHLASASREQRFGDFESNVACLRDATGQDCRRWLSYPYGGPTSFDDAVVADAREFGCRFALTSIRGVNGAAIDCMRLRRVDTNDVVGGKSPVPWTKICEQTSA